MSTTDASAVILAVDLGAGTLAAGLVDSQGTMWHSQSVPTDRLGRGGGILENLLQVVGALAEEAGVLGRPIRGVGVGVPGVVRVDTGTIGPDIHNIPEFRGLALGQILRERTGLPVVVDNDVNALTLGEWTFGQARGCRHVAMITVGTSIGGGLILGGLLLRGAGGYAGEIGHTTVDLDGPECFCGSRGCLKVFASGQDIARRGRGMLARGGSSILAELAGGDPDRIDAPMVFAAAAKGDLAAAGVVSTAARALGVGVANLINLCNPEIVLLGGGVMAAGEILMEPLRRWARYYAFDAAFDETRILRSGLTKASGILGAAALFLYEQGPRPTTG